jgi:hypothetical protein
MRQISIIVVLACVLTGTPAHAQSAHDEAIALALFADGRVLASNNDFVHACEKYEAARSLAPWLGIELNLADCYERIGRTASAWALFRKATADAEKLADPRSGFAHERAEALEPTLSRVTIRAVAGVTIVLDATPFASAGLGVPVPVDPGVHVVAASAPEHVPWSARVSIAPGSAIVIDVPGLEATPVPPAVALAPVVQHVRARRGLVLALGSVGIATVGTAVILGLDAKLRYDDVSGGHCDSALACDPYGYAAIRDARLRGNVATVIGGIGVAAIGAALIVHLTAPTSETRATLIPVATAGTVGLAVAGPL